MFRAKKYRHEELEKAESARDRIERLTRAIDQRVPVEPRPSAPRPSAPQNLFFVPLPKKP